ncbi:DsbA family protein [Bradyrhizobium sp. Pa8]|uniref:DsbA family oxidoreductase n=1 Tax=Bradyrhizobium sp. Pa8 TaxID=3386552 RepID=UPI00403F4983
MSSSPKAVQQDPLRDVEPIDARVVHWFDFICPFCYVSQDRDELVAARGLDIVDLPLRAHPEISLAGVRVGPRRGPMYRHIEAEARAAGLVLNWPSRLPSSSVALGAAEWARRIRPAISREFNRSLFEAHFVLNQDIGDEATILRHAALLGLDPALLAAALADGSTAGWIRESESAAHRHGVRGTPAWLYRGRLLEGARSAAEFFRFLEAD